MVFLNNGPHLLLPSLDRTLNKCNPGVRLHDVFNEVAASTASPQLPSNTTNGVALPCPGSLLPKKNSPWVTATLLAAGVLLFRKITFLNLGPQLLLTSFTRTFNNTGLERLGTDCADAMIDSIISLKSPSVAVNAVPVPTPGSMVPQKYSPAIMRDGVTVD